MHIFPFSRRRGTAAADMPNQIPPETKSARIEELRVIESELRDQYYRSLEGTKLRVLVESPVEGRAGTDGGHLVPVCSGGTSRHNRHAKAVC